MLFLVKAVNHQEHLAQVFKQLYRERSLLETICVKSAPAESAGGTCACSADLGKAILTTRSARLQDCLIRRTRQRDIVDTLAAIPPDDLNAILEFLCLGEVALPEDKMDSFVASSKLLEIYPLCQLSWPQSELSAKLRSGVDSRTTATNTTTTTTSLTVSEKRDECFSDTTIEWSASEEWNQGVDGGRRRRRIRKKRRKEKGRGFSCSSFASSSSEAEIDGDAGLEDGDDDDDEEEEEGEGEEEKVEEESDETILQLSIKDLGEDLDGEEERGEEEDAEDEEEKEEKDEKKEREEKSFSQMKEELRENRRKRRKSISDLVGGVKQRIRLASTDACILEMEFLEQSRTSSGPD